MPGIYGLVGTESETDLHAMLAAMAGRLRHHSWYTEDHHLDATAGLALGRVALGFVNTAEQPAFNEDRSLLAMMAGEIHDDEDERRALKAAGHQFRGTSHAELLLHGFESRGKDYFRGLHGCFAAAIWDVRARRLILTNDRFGMKPLYYARRPGRLLFASAIKALRADPELPHRLDPRGVAQFFTFGQLLGEDTLLEAVRTLPAAAWVTFDACDDRLTVDRYWRLEGGAVASGAEALDRIDDAFQRAVNRRVGGPGRLGLSLSGGLDSRTILAVLDTARTPITTVSMGVEGSIDHRAASRMAEIVGCPHHCCFLDETFLERFEEHMRFLVRLTDGHYLSQCVTVPTLPLYRELGIEVLLRGHAGELMHMDKAYNFSLDRTVPALHSEAALEDWLSAHLRVFLLGSAPGRLFSGAFGRDMESLAQESLRDCLRESEGLGPPANRIAHLFLTQRLRRETALSMVEFGSLVETRLPYLDNDLIDALFACPPELKRSDTIQAHILRRRRPAFLNVVNANTGARLGAGRLTRTLARGRLKVLGKLRVRGYQPYERLGLWLRRELSPLVRRILLDDHCLGRGVFDPKALQSVVEAHLSGRQNHTFLLMAAMLFELGQRALAETDPGPCAAPSLTPDRTDLEHIGSQAD